MKSANLYHENHAATYCPEDDKIRLYVGRVPRDQYEALRAEGWTSTPKQDCDFVAVWTPQREDTALAYAGEIDDEDTPPQERAADRAERFAGYRDKRATEATGHADRYDAGPQVHGYQSRARAIRAADRHDRQAGRAVNCWDKAEYWQARTAGVIEHALHLSGPGVRMGRIKTLEAELRAAEKSEEQSKARRALVEKIAADPEAAIVHMLKRFSKDRTEAVRDVVEMICGGGEHINPKRPEDPPAYVFKHLATEDPPTVADYAAHWLATHPAPGSPEWEASRLCRSIRHLRLRLDYENQMLEAQGGRLAAVEIERGGSLGGRVVAKVNKSPKTGRVVSVSVVVPAVDRWAYRVTNEPGTPFALMQVETERLAPGAYTAPTPESLAKLAEFDAAVAAVRGAAKAGKEPCPLVNPTRDDAERLQAAWNAAALADHCARHLKAYGRDYADEFKPSTVREMTQADYSAASRGSYSTFETRTLCDGARLYPSHRRDAEKFTGRALCKVRVSTGNGSTYGAKCVVLLTDKPGKPLPADVWAAVTVEA